MEASSSQNGGPKSARSKGSSKRRRGKPPVDDKEFPAWWAKVMENRKRVRRKREPPKDGLTLAQRIELSRRGSIKPEPSCPPTTSNADDSDPRKYDIPSLEESGRSTSRAPSSADTLSRSVSLHLEGGVNGHDASTPHGTPKRSVSPTNHSHHHVYHTYSNAADGTHQRPPSGARSKQNTRTVSRDSSSRGSQDHHHQPIDRRGSNGRLSSSSTQTEGVVVIDLGRQSDSRGSSGGRSRGRTPTPDGTLPSIGNNRPRSSQSDSERHNVVILPDINQTSRSRPTSSHSDPSGDKQYQNAVHKQKEKDVPPKSRVFLAGASPTQPSNKTEETQEKIDNLDNELDQKLEEIKKENDALPLGIAVNATNNKDNEQRGADKEKPSSKKPGIEVVADAADDSGDSDKNEDDPTDQKAGKPNNGPKAGEPKGGKKDSPKDEANKPGKGGPSAEKDEPGNSKGGEDNPQEGGDKPKGAEGAGSPPNKDKPKSSKKKEPAPPEPPERSDTALAFDSLMGRDFAAEINATLKPKK